MNARTRPLRWSPPGERRKWLVERFDGRWPDQVQHRIARLAVRPLVDALLQAVFAVDVVNGPAPARSVLISRHTSYWDPLLVALCDLRIKPLGNEYWFHHGPFPWYGRHVRALPNNFVGVCQALSHLRRDGLVWIAPAGFTAHETGPAQPGAYRLASIAQASLVPVIIDGLDALPTLTPPIGSSRHRVSISYGTPRRLDSSAPPDEREQAWREALDEAGVPT